MSGRAWWLSAAALLLFLAAASLGIAVTFLDPNDYKPQIIAAVQQATGRTLSLGGPLRISRSLWPTWPGRNASRRSCPCSRYCAAAS